MKISLMLLCEMLYIRYGIVTERESSVCGARKYRSARLAGEVCTESDLLGVRQRGDGSEIFADNESAFAAGCGYERLYNAVISVFEQMNQWCGRMRIASWMPDAVAEIIKIAGEQLPHPMYAADSGYKIYAMSDHPEMCHMSHSWKYAYNQGYLPLDIILSLSASRELQKEARLNSAYITSSESFNNPFLNYIVSHNGKVCGHFFMIEILRKFHDYEVELAQTVGDCLSLALTKNTQFNNISGTLYEHFIVDVMDETLTDTRLIRSQIEALKWSKLWGLCVLRIRPADYDDLALRAICNLIEHRLKNTAVVPYQDAIAAVSRFEGPEDYESFIMDLRMFLKGSELRAGISDVLEDFMHLPDGIWQADAAVECSAGSALTHYSDIAFEHFAALSAEVMPARRFVHPVLKQLKNIDRQENSALYETLKCYIECDRAVGTAAQRLFLHRNTLMKRLEKIQRLTGLDLDNHSIVKRLLLSFALDY